MRYPFIRQHTGQFCVAALCRTVNVSRSGYYAWLSRKPSERQRENQMLLCRIRQFFERSKRTYGSLTYGSLTYGSLTYGSLTYGSPRILQDLREEGFCCSFTPA